MKASVPTPRRDFFSKTDSKRGKIPWQGKHSQNVNDVLTKKRHITFLGDSLVSNFWRRPDLLTFGGEGFNNFGIGGDKTENVLYRVLHGEVTKHSRMIFLHVGANNVLRRDLPEEILGGIEAICNAILGIAPHCSICVSTIVPMGGDFKIRQAIKSTNNILREWAQTFGQGVTLVDHDKLTWFDSEGTLNRDLFWKDLIHLSNPLGLSLLANSFRNHAKLHYGGKLLYIHSSEFTNPSLDDAGIGQTTSLASKHCSVFEQLQNKVKPTQTAARPRKWADAVEFGFKLEDFPALPIPGPAPLAIVCPPQQRPVPRWVLCEVVRPFFKIICFNLFPFFVNNLFGCYGNSYKKRLKIVIFIQHIEDFAIT